MIILFWLETSPVDQQAAIRLMSLVHLGFLGENVLDEVISPITGAGNQIPSV